MNNYMTVLPVKIKLIRAYKMYVLEVVNLTHD
jgi:hypothetical protein